MAVSYVSKVFENSPLIAPLDLEVLAKVLSVKQNNYDIAANKLQGQVDSAINLDLMRGVDKEYANSKINNIVNQVNSLGGVDLGDFNVNSQIEGFINSTYNDQNIITAISSTKRARALLASYDKFKTDPKLIKYYSEANEYNDTKGLSAWMNGEEVGQSYSGPSQATRYVDYNTNFQKALKDVKAKKNVTVLGQGYYITKDTKEILTEGEVMSMARDLMTPEERNQMQRDGTYLYEGKLKYGEAEIVNKAISHKQNELQNNGGAIKILQDALLVETDPKSKQRIKQEIKERETYSTALKSEIQNAIPVYSKIYKSNPSELMYMVYSQDYFRGLGKRYSIHQEDRSVTADQAKLEKFRQESQNTRQINTINAASNLQTQRDNAAKERLLLELEADGKVKKNADGSYKITAKAGEEDVKTFYDIQPNLDTGDTEAYVESTKDRLGLGEGKSGIGSIDSEIATLQENFLSKAAAYNPELEAVLRNTTSYDYNNDGKVTLSDFQGTVQKNGNNVLAYSTITDPKAQALVSKMLQAYESLGKGQPIAINKFPKGIGELYEKISLLEQEKVALRDGLVAYNTGNDKFMRPQYSSKTFSTDPNFQKSAEIGKIRSYLITKLKSSTPPSDFTILGIEKNTSKGGGYNLKYQVKDKEPTSIKVGDNIAAFFDIEEGPYSVLNRSVNSQTPFHGYIQNNNDYKFVAPIRIIKVGNSEKYAALYGVKDEKTNTLEYVPLPDPNTGKEEEFTSAAQAYMYAKESISNFGKTLKDKENLKSIFDNKILNR